MTNGSDANGSSTTRPFHLCLLAITIIDLHQAAIWQEWAAAANAAIANTDTSSDNDNDNGDCPIVVSLIGHAKHPNRVRNDWFRSKLLLVPPERNTNGPSSRLVYHTRRPEWGSIEITQAMMDLAREACRIGTAPTQVEHDIRYSRDRYNANGPNGSDTTRPGLPPVDCVVYISETCLPVVSLHDFVRTVRSDPNKNKSWLQSRNTPNNGYARQQQFERINSVIPVSKRHKADQWILLQRPHLQAVVDLDASLPLPLHKCFQHTRASDELYFPTALAILGILASNDGNDNNNNSNVVQTETGGECRKQRVTYADWSMSAKNPASFRANELKKVTELARKEGCLIARKFSERVEIRNWKAIVLGESTKEGMDKT